MKPIHGVFLSLVLLFVFGCSKSEGKDNGDGGDDASVSTPTGDGTSAMASDTGGTNSLPTDTVTGTSDDDLSPSDTGGSSDSAGTSATSDDTGDMNDLGSDTTTVEASDTSNSDQAVTDVATDSELDTFVSDAGTSDSGEVSSETGATDQVDTGSTDVMDGGASACLDGYDSANPRLKIRAMVPTEPQTMVDIAGGTQGAMDEDRVIYLFSMSNVIDGGSSAGSLGAGEVSDAATESYAYVGQPSAMTFDVAGDSFSSTSSDTVIFGLEMLSGVQLSIPIQEVTMTGTFNDASRCAIGTQLSEGPPSTWETGGTMGGKVTVEDAKNNVIEITREVAGQEITQTFSFCAYLAYGTSLELLQDPDCEADSSTWTYPPTETTNGGESAWLFSFDYAATAALITQ